MAFAEHGFWGRNLASIIVVVFVGAAWMITFGPSAFMAAFLTGSALANEVHFLAHSPSSGNALTRVLQQTGVMQSPKSHALHHRPPHNRNYCVLTDWLNPFVEALR
jgi:ubiquitin-conjugating enzyme E2 variant